MADRYFYKFQTAQKESKKLYSRVAIGASGAPTLSTTIRNGFESITRTGAGTYDVVLQDTYNAYLSFDIGRILGGTGEDLTFVVTAQNSTASGGGTFTFETLTAGTPTDPASGDILHVNVDCKNSSVNF